MKLEFPAHMTMRRDAKRTHEYGHRAQLSNVNGISARSCIASPQLPVARTAVASAGDCCRCCSSCHGADLHNFAAARAELVATGWSSGRPASMNRVQFSASNRRTTRREAAQVQAMLHREELMTVQARQPTEEEAADSS